jgi:hypothetical protein
MRATVTASGDTPCARNLPVMTETGDTDGPSAIDRESLAGTIREARAKFLQAQKLILTSERAEQRIRKHGKEPGPELAEGRERLDQMLDQLTSVIGRAEAMLAAYGTADGGAPLTAEQAGYFLQIIGASDSLTAAHREKPDETTAILNNLLTQIEGPFETRLGYIVTYMGQV